METYLCKILKVVIVLSLVCFLFDTAFAESIGIKSENNFRASQALPKVLKMGGGEKITPAIAGKTKAPITKFETRSAAPKSDAKAQGKMESIRSRFQFRDTETVSNNGVSTSSSVSEYSFDRPAVKTVVEIAPKVSTPKVSRVSSASTAKPAKIDILK